MLGLLIKHFDPASGSTAQDAYIYASAVIALAWASAVIGHHSNVGMLQIGMRVRIACSSLIYRKVIITCVFFYSNGIYFDYN